MHRVVVVPLAAPDETMLLENPNDLPGNFVSVAKVALTVGFRPSPIVGVRAGDIDGDAETVRALTIGPGDEAAVVGSLRWRQIRKESLRQPIELVGYALQRCRGAVDFAELETFSVLSGQPDDIGRVRHDIFGPAVGVHLSE